MNLTSKSLQKIPRAGEPGPFFATAPKFQDEVSLRGSNSAPIQRW